MQSNRGDPLPPRPKRGPLRAVALIVGIVALLALASVWMVRQTSNSTGAGPITSPTQSAVVAGPTAVPTLDFFRGRSYPTPTPQPIP